MTHSRRLVLVRHGQTEANADGVFIGSTDAPLTLHGKRQALELSASLRPDPSDAVVASPMQRAVSTADLATPGGSVTTDVRLREVDFGAWEGRTAAEVRRSDPEGLEAFEACDIRRFAGGESVSDAARRLRSAIDEPLAEPAGDGRLIAVTHATAIRLLCASLLNLPVQRYRALLGRPDHCSMSELHNLGGVWRLESYNLVPHAGAAP